MFESDVWDHAPKQITYTGDQKFWRPDDPIIKEYYDPDTDKTTKEIIKGGMFQPQRDVWGLNNFVKVFVGGYGSGKSFVLGKRAIATCLQNAPHASAIFTPTYPMAKTTTIPTIKELLDGKKMLLGKSFRYTLTLQPPIKFVIYYKGRMGTLYILSADRPDSLKGVNLASVLMEEPFIQPQASFEQAIARIRVVAPISEVFITGTPEGRGWGWELCEGELREKYDVGVVRASSHTNQANAQDYAERMESGYDSLVARVYVHGEFHDLTSGRIYYSYSSLDHDMDLEIPDEAKIGFGMDFNVDPMAFVVFWWIPGKCLHYLKEYQIPNSDTDYACKVLTEDWGKYGSRFQDAFPDASGNQRRTSAAGATDHSIIASHGYKIRAHGRNPAIRDRYNAMNAMLKSSDDRVRITIGKECKLLRKYLRNYVAGEINTTEGKSMSHLLDAATYPVAYLFPCFRSRSKISKLRGD